MTTPIPALKSHLLVYGTLLALLALTAASAQLTAGPWSLSVALGIATAKLALIYIFFMRLGVHQGMERVAALAGFCWLGFLLALTFTDYLHRGGN
jgi:caa(3)-type oxidase subunit IV